MADGSVIFDTKIDESGLRTGLSKLGSKVTKGISVALAAAGTALVGLGKQVVTVGADFEEAMSNVAATMGKTVDQIPELSAKAQELGRTTKFTATEAAEGLNILAQAGFSVEDQLYSIDSVLSLASAGEMSMADAAQYVSVSLKTMTSEMEGNGNMADHIADVYAKGATLAMTSTAEFGDAVSRAAPIGGQFNQTLENMAAELLVMADGGMQGSQAGTYLNRAMRDLYTPTDQARKAMDALGVSAYDAEGKQRNFRDVITDLEASMADLTEEEKANYVNMIFTGQGTLAYGLLTKKTAEEVKGLHDQLVNCDNAAKEMAKTKLDNLKGSITILKSATDGLYISLYNALNESKGGLKDFVDFGTEQIGILQAAFDEGGFEGMVSALGEVLANMTEKIVSYMPTLFRAASSLVSSLVQGLTANAGSIAQSAASLLDIFLDSVLSITTDLVKLGGELIIALCEGLSANMGNILTTITDGLIGLVTAIIDYFPQVIQAGADLLVSFVQGIAEATPKLLEAIPALFTQLLAAIRASAQTILTAVTEIVQLIVDNLPGMLQMLVDMLPGMIQEYADALIEWYPILAEGIANIITMLAEALPELITILVEALPGLIDTIVAAIGELIPVFIECVMTIVMAIVEALPGIINSIIAVLPTLINSIIGALLEMLPLIVDCGVQLFVALVQALPEIIYDIVSVLPQIIAAIISTLVGMIPQLIQCGIELLTSLISALPQIILTIVAAIPQIIMAIVRALIDSIPQIVQAGINLLTSLIQSLPSIIVTIVSAIPKIVASLVSAIVGNVGKIAAAGVQLLGSLITNLPSIISKLVGAIPQIISALISSFSSFVGKFVEVGKNLLLGLGQGIANAVGTVVAKAKAVASNIWSSVKSFFGIASPSKLFRDSIGKNLVLGLAEGLTDNAKEAIGAAEDLASDLAGVSFGIQTPEVKAPKVDFDPDDYDFDAIMANVRGTVNATAATTGRAVSAGSASQSYSKGDDDGTASNDQDEKKPVYVYNVLEMDGKVFARTATPYIEKELNWRDK